MCSKATERLVVLFAHGTLCGDMNDQFRIEYHQSHPFLEKLVYEFP